jgi:hypothetical protein
VNHLRRTLGVALATIVVAVPGLTGQEHGADVREAYFRAVADFFDLPTSEISILGAWRMPAEEIPVALFLARHAGVSAEAIVALRRSGRGWSELATRYQVGAAQFYVPLPEGAPAGVLQSVYDRYRALPTPSWSQVALADRDIVALVNLRVLSQTLQMAPADVLAVAGDADWVNVYARLLREPDASRGDGVEG